MRPLSYVLCILHLLDPYSSSFAGGFDVVRRSRTRWHLSENGTDLNVSHLDLSNATTTERPRRQKKTGGNAFQMTRLSSVEYIGKKGFPLETSPFRPVMNFYKDGKLMSPWHDIPSHGRDGLLNFACEIPKGSRVKMECSTTRPYNSFADAHLREDVENGWSGHLRVTYQK